jgi:hypothetical protein
MRKTALAAPSRVRVARRAARICTGKLFWLRVSTVNANPRITHRRGIEVGRVGVAITL